MDSKKGTFLNARALMDPCSEGTLILESLVKRLRLPRERCSIQITGVGDSRTTTLVISKFIIRSRIKKSCCYQVETNILDDVTSYSPKYDPAVFNLKHLKGLPLADPNFFSNARIERSSYIGTDIFQLILPSGVSKSTFSALHHLIRLFLHLLKSLILMTSCFLFCKPFGK